jgi:DNA-binding GntR family transcriptional regulator
MALIEEAIKPIQQTTLADAVCEQIRRAIVTGVLTPGQRLSETILSAHLGVSRSPVREALQRLQLEGLVVGQTNRSCTVWNPSVADVKEIFSLREMIETLAAEWCVENLTEEDFQAMEQIIQRQSRAIEAQDYVNLIKEDKLFHEFICLRANHQRLMEWWQQIMGQWEVLIYRRLLANPDEVVPSVIRDHHAIMDALRSRDINHVRDLHRQINERVIITTAAALAK